MVVMKANEEGEQGKGLQSFEKPSNKLDNPTYEQF